MATSPVRIYSALNQPSIATEDAIDAITARLDSLEPQVVTNTNNITAVTSRVSALEPQVTQNAANISTLTNRVNVIDAKVTDLITRMDRLEALLLFPGPEVGVVVHLKNRDGDCVAAIVYEDPTKRNNPNTISVVYVNPDEPNWVHRADIRESNGTIVSDVPFNNWHQPEWSFVP